MESNDKILKKEDKIVITTKYGLGSRLCEGKILGTPHMHFTQLEPPN